MKSLVPWKWGKHDAAPARWDRWLDRMWESPFESLLPSWGGTTLSAKLPSVDVAENGKEVKVRAEIPGMTEKDIGLQWHDGVLRIRGEKQEEREDKGKNRYYRECSYGSFTRDVAVGANVDWQNAKAKYKHGVLTVTLPKDKTDVKRIEVKVQ